MRKTVNAVKARGNLGQILEEVYYRGDQYVIERSGKPMAAVVPVEQYEQWMRERETFFQLVDRIRGRNKRTRPEKIEQDIEAATRQASPHPSRRVRKRR
jgi:prevent-host-death family protein